MKGPWAETSATTHRAFPHNEFGTNQPHPTYPVIRSEFDKSRKAYWRARGEQFL